MQEKVKYFCTIFKVIETVWNNSERLTEGLQNVATKKFNFVAGSVLNLQKQLLYYLQN
jgi:hypothetical protein